MKNDGWTNEKVLGKLNYDQERRGKREGMVRGRGEGVTKEVK